MDDSFVFCKIHWFSWRICSSGGIKWGFDFIDEAFPGSSWIKVLTIISYLYGDLLRQTAWEYVVVLEPTTNLWAS